MIVVGRRSLEEPGITVELLAQGTGSARATEVFPREMAMKITTGLADPAVRTLLNVPPNERVTVRADRGSRRREGFPS